MGTIDYDVFGATDGAVILPIAVPGREDEWAQTADEFAKAHPAFSSNYTEDGSYTRLREISMGVRLDQFLTIAMKFTKQTILKIFLRFLNFTAAMI